MVFFSLAILAGAALALAARRDLTGLASFRLREVWLAPLAVFLQLSGGPPLWHRAGIVLSLCLVALLVWRNRHLVGMPLVAGGWALNSVAMLANGGLMPSTPGATAAAGVSPLLGSGGKWAVMDPTAIRLFPLTDAIPLGWPIRNVVSVGDLVLVLGIATIVFYATRARSEGEECTEKSIA